MEISAVLSSAHQNQTVKRLLIVDVEVIVADVFGMKTDDIRHGNQSPLNVRARQVSFWIANNILRRSKSSIARTYGLHHTSVCYGCARIGRELGVPDSSAARLYSRKIAPWSRIDKQKVAAAILKAVAVGPPNALSQETIEALFCHLG